MRYVRICFWADQAVRNLVATVLQQDLPISVAVWSHAAGSRGSFQGKRGKAWRLEAVREKPAGIHKSWPMCSLLPEHDLHSTISG